MPTAIITGASAGIGAATAELFQGAGYRLYNLSRRACPVDGVTSIRCDLAQESSIAEAIAILQQELEKDGEISLIHNASQMRKDTTRACTSASLLAVMQTNIIAVNSLNQSLLPLMGPRSSVIYIGSTLAEKAVPGAFSYVVSKHALVGMMRATCQDLMGSGIHTACVCPGITDTEMLRTHLDNDPQILDTMASLNSFNRLIEPMEIAELIFWAHRNPVINGSVLHAHLGQKEN